MYLQPYSNRRNELIVEEGYILCGYQVIILKCVKGKLLQELHQDHPGVTRMMSVARSYMWWPGLDEEPQAILNRHPLQPEILSLETGGQSPNELVAMAWTAITRVQRGHRRCLLDSLTRLANLGKALKIRSCPPPQCPGLGCSARMVCCTWHSWTLGH